MTSAQPSGDGVLSDPQEVTPFETEQELLVVRESDELEVDAALPEGQLRERQGERGDEREQTRGRG